MEITNDKDTKKISRFNFGGKRLESTQFIFQNLPLWIASCVIGLVSVLYTEFLHVGESFFLSLYHHHKAWVFLFAPVSLFV